MPLLLKSLFILMIFQSFPAFAGNRCESIFIIDKMRVQSEVRSLIEKHYEPRDIPDFLENFFLQKISKKIKLHRSANPLLMRQTLVEKRALFFLLSKPESSQNQWLRRELLARDLDSLALSFNLKTEDVPHFFKKIFRNKAVQFALNPLKLPELSDRLFSDVFIEKILRDGPGAHRLEIENIYKQSGQSKIDGYRRFARIYQAVALSVFTWILWRDLKEMKEDINFAQRERLDEDLQSLENLLLLLTEEFESRSSDI